MIKSLELRGNAFDCLETWRTFIAELFNRFATGHNGFWSGSCVWTGAEKVTGTFRYLPE